MFLIWFSFQFLIFFSKSDTFWQGCVNNLFFLCITALTQHEQTACADAILNTAARKAFAFSKPNVEDPSCQARGMNETQPIVILLASRFSRHLRVETNSCFTPAWLIEAVHEAHGTAAEEKIIITFAFHDPCMTFLNNTWGSNKLQIESFQNLAMLIPLFSCVRSHE